MHPIAIIGDVHGCYFTLKALYEQLLAHCPEENLYSVGDLVDRGRYSREVISFCIQFDIKAVRGNHEQILLNAITDPRAYDDPLAETRKDFLFNGGAETALSYCDQPPPPPPIDDLMVEFRNALLNEGHLEWLYRLPMYYDFPGVFVSHAGVSGSRTPHDLMWNRKPLDHIGKLQVIGHTPARDVIFEAGYYANVDTGCVYGRKLSAVVIDADTGRLYQTLSQPADPRDISQ